MMIERTWKSKYSVLLLICFAAATCPMLVSAQIDFRAGYIVRNGEDTTKGFLAYRVDKQNLKNCLFKKTKKEKPQSFTASELKGYGFNNDKTYEALVLPKGYPSPPEGKVFVKTLVQGALTLYQYNEYFLLKTQDSLFVLPLPVATPYGNPTELRYQINKKYVGILNFLMLDCKIDPSKAGYTEGDLTDVVYRYDLCKSKTATRKNLSPLGKLNFQVFTGYVNSSFVYEGTDKTVPFSPSITVLGGAGVEISSPRIFDKLFFTVEGWMVKAVYQGFYEGTLGGDPIRQDIFMNVSYLKIPFGIKYNFKGDGNTPYVRVGGYWSYTQSSSIRTIQEKDVQGVIYTDDIAGGYQIKNPKGYWLSVGYDKSMYKRAHLFTECRVEMGEGYIGSPVVNLSRLSNINVLLGLRF